MNLHEILLKKAAKGELAHFYLVETSAPSDEASDLLEDFIHHFIRDYYQKIEGHKQSMNRLMDHPDVFVLGNVKDDEEPEDASFTVLESEALNRFFEFKPVQSKRKFAVITESHRITTVVANKWLKLLEEPNGISTIFVLNPRRQKLLDTIHSRALHLRLPAKPTLGNHDAWNKFLADTKGFTLSPFLEKIPKAYELDFLVNELIHWETEQFSRSLGKEALEKWLKTYQEMEIYHQPHATKWTLFFTYLEEQVFPRLKDH